jgi:hypothetical protein
MGKYEAAAPMLTEREAVSDVFGICGNGKNAD